MAKTSPFSKSFLKEIEDILVLEKNRLETELRGFTNKNPKISGDYEASYPEYGDESDENAREIADYTVNKPLEISLEKTLRDVNKSLERIEKGTYGICKYCDSPISEKRLRARPTSGSCVECKKTLTQEI